MGDSFLQCYWLYYDNNVLFRMLLCPSSCMNSYCDVYGCYRYSMSVQLYKHSYCDVPHTADNLHFLVCTCINNMYASMLYNNVRYILCGYKHNDLAFFQLLDHFENIYSQILLFYYTTGIKKPLSDHPSSGHFRQVWR